MRDDAAGRGGRGATAWAETPRAALTSKTAMTLLWFVGLAAAAYLGPRALGLDGRDGAGSESVAELARTVIVPSGSAHGAALPAALAAGAAPATEPPPAPSSSRRGGEESRGLLEDPSGRALERFHESLATTSARGRGAVTRVVHYGDSMLTSDGISGALRRRLQQRFGNAGHGFVLAGRPWPWYSHQGVRLWSSPGWDVYPVTSSPLLDGCMGLGAVAFRSTRPGARFRVEPDETERVSRFELFYLAHPRGGRLRVTVDGAGEEEIDTRAERPSSGFHAVTVPEGRRRLEVRNVGGGQVRIFGVALERSGPGVVYDSLGVNGLHAVSFERFAGEHLSEQLRHRAPALLVVTLGTNESQLEGLRPAQHASQYASMLRLLRAGAPEASCLVMSPPDRAARTASGQAATRPVIPRIVEAQRVVARAEGCAFFDTFAAMGGVGSAARWRTVRPVLMGGDMTHPTAEGADVIGARLFEALMAGYESWHATRQPDGSAGTTSAPSSR